MILKNDTKTKVWEIFAFTLCREVIFHVDMKCLSIYQSIPGNDEEMFFVC